MDSEDIKGCSVEWYMIRNFCISEISLKVPYLEHRKTAEAVKIKNNTITL